MHHNKAFSVMHVSQFPYPAVRRYGLPMRAEYALLPMRAVAVRGTKTAFPLNTLISLTIQTGEPDGKDRRRRHEACEGKRGQVR
jgi:hypothetical protein